MDKDTDLVWNREGPLGSKSKLKCAYFNGGQRPQIKVRNDGSFLLDFENSFTMAVWVKTDDQTDHTTNTSW